jgi:hypothetical protein
VCTYTFIYCNAAYRCINTYIEFKASTNADERFVRCYNTREEAISHVKYQQDVMHSTANWHVQHIKITFEEQESFIYNPTK